MNARALAIEILFDVIINGQYANLALKQRLTEVSKTDQPLVTALVYTTLQHHRTVRAWWMSYVSKYPKAKVAIVLDCAACQLRYFDKLPDYAIVHESVEWLKQNKFDHHASMVNAVLHKLIQEGVHDLKGEDEFDTFALNAAIPTWLYKLWISHYGLESAQKIALSLLNPAHVHGRVNTLKTTVEKILQDPHLHASALGHYSVLSDENLVHSTYVKNGEIWLQDDASAYVSEFVDAKPNTKVLDVCSAPGSKAAGLAASMKNTGSITAIELHPARAKLIGQLMNTLGIDIVETKTLDARDLAHHLPAGDYDTVLADVPCSGLGVMRRKADIKIRLTPAQLDEIEGLQKAILDGVAGLVKPEGVLVYSTCTLNKKENENQIRHFLKKYPEYSLLEERTIFPFEYDSDGFYMAKLKRTA